MAYNVANWVAESTTTTGTGVVTLDGAATPQDTTFKLGFGSDPVTVYYSIQDTGNNNWEAGLGTYDGGVTLTRTRVDATIDGGVYYDENPSPISLSGTATVRCTFNAQAFRDFIRVWDQEADPTADAEPGDVWTRAAGTFDYCRIS